AFVKPPRTFVGGLHEFDACLVGPTTDGVVLAFRGTLPLVQVFTNIKALLDWINDFMAEPVAAAGLPGQVHRGLLRSLDNLWSQGLAEVKAQLTMAGAGARLLVTGHSKGGGVAPLAALRLRATEGISAKVITFAAPKAGNAAFAASYTPQVEHVRYEFADDIVPHVPPSESFLKLLTALPNVGHWFDGLARLNYVPVGKLQFINWSGHIVDDM